MINSEAIAEVTKLYQSLSSPARIKLRVAYERELALAHIAMRDYQHSGVSGDALDSLRETITWTRFRIALLEQLDPSVAGGMPLLDAYIAGERAAAKGKADV